MTRERKALINLILLSVFSLWMLLLSCREKLKEGMIIMTLVSNNPSGIIDPDSSRFNSLSKIAIIDPERPDGTLKVLTEDFYSAMSPEVSSDGKYLLFTGQKSQNDPWQIFEMDLTNREIKKITSSGESCTDPAYLPNGKVVFRMNGSNETNRQGQPLCTCERDGTNLSRITFNPNSYSYLTVLKDGRVLALSRQLYPIKGIRQFIALRPDGTKAELFYYGLKSNSPVSKGYETGSGKLVFIESEENSLKGNIISVNYNRPLHTRVNLTENIKGDFRSVLPLASGKLLVSWKSSESGRYGLYEFNPENKTTGKVLFISQEFDVSEAVLTGKHEKPRKLPSEVDKGVKTGLLLCQDVNVMDPASEAYIPALHKAASIEVMGPDSSLGVVPVEKDGSFYLKVIADTPFQIRTLDEKGNSLPNQCSWIWLRPNERRGCVGCHEDHEQVPDNRVPLAVKKAPVNIPVHISKVKEKKVELE